LPRNRRKKKAWTKCNAKRRGGKDTSLEKILREKKEYISKKKKRKGIGWEREERCSVWVEAGGTCPGGLNQGRKERSSIDDRPNE